MQAVIDVETTGLVRGVNEIIEIAVLQFDDNFELTGNIFHSLVKPNTMPTAEVTKINNIGIPELTLAPTASQVRKRFVEWKLEVFGEESIVPLGHNYGFDKGFLENFFKDLYLDLFHYRNRDSQQAAIFLRDCGVLTARSTGLEALAEHFSLKSKGDLHRAVSDAEMTLEVYKELILLQKEIV
jgi:DNA polymerase III epsilon subunit-like protein